MDSILALDPGPKQTGWCVFDAKTREIRSCGVDENEKLLGTMMRHGCDTLAIEMIASYGMAVGAEVFETCVWIGRYYQRWFDLWGAKYPVRLIYRKDVKMFLCGTPRAKNANIRQRLIDLLGPQGTKKAPGPTYGVKSHAWPALAVATTVAGVTA